MNKPTNSRYYNPQEPTPRYPLELEERLHIALWDESGKFKWSIADFRFEKEGPEVRFFGDRPFDQRVNWEHLRELLKHGQLLADVKVFKYGEGGDDD